MAEQFINGVRVTDYGKSPVERGTEHMALPYRGIEGKTNRHGVLALEYETDEHERDTGWNKYQCKCGAEFWKRVPYSLARGCGNCGDGRGAQTKLDLIGRTFGRLEVVDHVRGRGWVVKCKCGNEKYIMNSTQLANGGNKSCGVCWMSKEHQSRLQHYAGGRSQVTASSGAPPPSPAHVSRGNAVVAGNMPPTKDIWAGRTMPNLAACAADHTRITYDIDANADGCPLCMALARIELLEADESQGTGY